MPRIGLKHVIFASCFMFLLYSIKTNFTKRLKHFYDPTVYPLKDGGYWQFTPSDEITIMMATSHYRDDLTEDIHLQKNEQFCPKKCRVVSYRTAPDEFLTANILIFHLASTDTDWSWFQQLSKKRNPDQIWAFYSMEPPPVLVEALPFGLNHDLGYFNNAFNWTIGYRSDSDVSRYYRDFIRYQKKDDTSTVEMAPRRVSIANKRHIAALISNCDAATPEYNRTKLIDELLSLGIDVDIYGKCGQFGKCPGLRAGHACYEYLEKKYLFYASFENSLCPEYYTEKFINILRFDMVPIVVGGANYSVMAPSSSFIDLRDFKSASHFADYIKTIAASEDLFNKYFEWKSHYHVQRAEHNGLFCLVCLKAHETYSKPKTVQFYDNIKDWILTKKSCKVRKFYRNSKNADVLLRN